MFTSHTPTRSLRFGDLNTMNQHLVAAGYHTMATASGGQELGRANHLEAAEAHLRLASAEPEFDFFMRKPKAISDEVVSFQPQSAATPTHITLKQVFRRPELLGLSYPLPNWVRHGFELFMDTLIKVGQAPGSTVAPHHFGQNADTLDLIELALQP